MPDTETASKPAKKTASKAPSKTPNKASSKTASKAATKPASKAATKKPVEKDPNGGLTAAGRAAFKEREGANLKPGVQGPADTPEKMKRKGSFLRRHYANLRGPLVDDSGKPTRLSLQAQAWGEPAPKTEAAAAKLAEKGTKLLEKYRQSKEKA
jgi:Domain of unknown function (DUF6321)